MGISYITLGELDGMMEQVACEPWIFTFDDGSEEKAFGKDLLIEYLRTYRGATDEVQELIESTLGWQLEHYDEPDGLFGNLHTENLS